MSTTEPNDRIARAKGPQLPGTVTSEELLVGGSDYPFRQLINNLLVMASQLQSLRSVLAKQLGVSEPQYRVFMAVAQLQGEEGISVTAVANALRVTGAFVTAEVGKLLKKNMLDKRSDPADRRGVLLSLSSAGREALERFAGNPQAINDELFKDITKDEFLTLSRIVRKLVSNAERAALVARALSSDEADGDFMRRLLGQSAPSGDVDKPGRKAGRRSKAKSSPAGGQ